MRLLTAAKPESNNCSHRAVGPMLRVRIGATAKNHDESRPDKGKAENHLHHVARRGSPPKNAATLGVFGYILALIISFCSELEGKTEPEISKQFRVPKT